MVWVFGSVALVLAVYNKGFRKVLLWSSPVWLLILAVAYG
jgi:hypothetical protein